MPRRGRRRRGASAVELALLLPLLALLFLAAVDFARLYYHYTVINNCARNGALYACDPTAAAESPYPDVTSAALADATDLSPQPAVSSQNTTDPAGNACVDVTVSYTFNTITSYPGLPSPVTLTQTVRMRMVPPSPN
jgi:Flp pilus assembly protein TadG